MIRPSALRQLAKSVGQWDGVTVSVGGLAPSREVMRSLGEGMVAASVVVLVWPPQPQSAANAAMAAKPQR